MTGNIAIEIQDFETLVCNKYFYIDKTDFMKDWWESGSYVTLITHPHGFGKTLTLSMLEHFFSLEYSGRSDMFQSLSIWKHEKYHQLQGSYPVITLSFANIKGNTFDCAKANIYELLKDIFSKFSFLTESDVLTKHDKVFFQNILSGNFHETDATSALYWLSHTLYRYYGKKVLIFLDAYDTPMQSAAIHGYCDEFVAFAKSFFCSTFKGNPWLERGIITGTTISNDDSLDLNLDFVSITSNKYTSSFGFTEEEISATLNKYNLISEQKQVTLWYSGFSFGKCTNIYHPCSILKFLKHRTYSVYLFDNSALSLEKIRFEEPVSLKEKFLHILQQEQFHYPIAEQLSYKYLRNSTDDIFALFVFYGYFSVIDYERPETLDAFREPLYTLRITNLETQYYLQNIIRNWFLPVKNNF